MITKEQGADDKIDENIAPNDRPPTYSPSEASGRRSTRASKFVWLSTPTKNVMPSNFTSVSQPSEIEGTWRIDPSLAIPASVLPPLSKGETEATRKNIRLETKDGQIDADITVIPCSVPDNETSRQKRVLIHARASNNPIFVKVHDGSSRDRSNPRRPIRLTAHNSGDNIQLHVPRSFRGPLYLKFRGGKVRFSAEVRAQVATFSENQRMHNCFLGDFVAEEWGEEGWPGDELEAETRDGTIMVQFDDEERYWLPSPDPKSFFKKVFGV